MSKPARLTETSVGTLVAVVGDAEQIRRYLVGVSRMMRRDFQRLFHNPGKSRMALSRKIFCRRVLRSGLAVVMSTFASEAPR